jgi:hypothetical protein
MSKSNNSGFVPVKNRNYLALNPRNREEKLILEEKLDLQQQMVELSTKAAQKWAAKPGAETCNTVTIRCYDYGNAYIGVVFIVSAHANESDRYAAYLLPTLEDGDALQADFSELAEEAGFVASKT